MKTALLAAAAVLLGACAGAPRTREVEAEGWAPVEKSDRRSADRRAEADALRRAVEAASGVSLAARTAVVKGAAAESRVVTRAAGCVLSHELISTGAEEGGRRAKVRAVVALRTEDCAGRAQLPPALLNDASVAVFVGADGAYAGELSRAAETGLRSALSARGYSLGAGKPGYRVVGTARATSRRDPRIAPMVGAHVELTVRVTAAADGRLLGEGRYASDAADADPASAVGAAASVAAADAARDALAALDSGSWRAP